jgi:general secretion pathway protein K
VALVVTLLAIAILTTLIAEFTFQTNVDFQTALNSRDELRADLAAQSVLDLSRLVIYLQKKLIDGNRMIRQAIGPVNLMDFAPMFLPAIAETGTEFKELASSFGVDANAVKGIGLGPVTIEIDPSSDDGRINLSCAGGRTSQAALQNQILDEIVSVIADPRYDRMFEQPDSNGAYSDRIETARAIIDYGDADESKVLGSATLLGQQSGSAPPSSSSAGPEDYRYDGLADPYKTKNHKYDSVEEMHMAKGVGDDFMMAFQEYFTVYPFNPSVSQGGCKMRIAGIRGDLVPMLVYMGAPANANRLEVVALARQMRIIGEQRSGLMGTPPFATVQEFVDSAKDPCTELSTLSPGAACSVAGMQLDANRIKLFVDEADRPRRIYRLRVSAAVGKVRRRVTAVWDNELFNPHPINPDDASERQGFWQYYRVE